MYACGVHVLSVHMRVSHMSAKGAVRVHVHNVHYVVHLHESYIVCGSYYACMTVSYYIWVHMLIILSACVFGACAIT